MMLQSEIQALHFCYFIKQWGTEESFGLSAQSSVILPLTRDIEIDIGKSRGFLTCTVGEKLLKNIVLG